VRRVLTIAVGIALLAPAAASAATYSNPHQLKTENFGAGDAGPMVPFPSVIDVRGTGTTVTGVKATLNGVAHDSSTEVQTLLVNPAGASVVLTFNVCGGQVTSANPLTLSFDDAAVAALPTTPTCSSGTFKPSWNSMLVPNFGPAGPPPPYGRALAGLTGGPADGLWQLYAYDNALTVDGAIDGGWTLELATTKPKKKCKRKGKGKRKRIAAAKKRRCKKKKR
jgi:hypothetical protein